MHGSRVQPDTTHSFRIFCCLLDVRRMLDLSRSTIARNFAVRSLSGHLDIKLTLALLNQCPGKFEAVPSAELLDPRLMADASCSSASDTSRPLGQRIDEISSLLRNQLVLRRSIVLYFIFREILLSFPSFIFHFSLSQN